MGLYKRNQSSSISRKVSSWLTAGEARKAVANC
jgi:hypothetical protein